ncbi:MAG: hypothetical protein JO053_03955, partial [Acidobacteria bacterium]|nr:hypothetical protein [Acidobacteriota bacterium]
MLDTKTMDTTNEINEQDTVSVTIRMEAPIHRAVKGVADREDRSLTKQIERILKKDAEV